jgi:hypothetical protein
MQNTPINWPKLLKMLRNLKVSRQLYLGNGFPTPSSAMIWPGHINSSRFADIQFRYALAETIEDAQNLAGWQTTIYT